MKRLTALVLSLVLLLGCFALAEEKTKEEWYEEGIAALSDPETYEYAAECFRAAGVVRQARYFTFYTDVLKTLTAEEELTRAVLSQTQAKMKLLGGSAAFIAEAEQNGLITVAQLTAYVDARIMETEGKFDEAMEIYAELKILNILDSADRYELLAGPNRPVITPVPTKTPRPTATPKPNYIYIENNFYMSITEVYIHPAKVGSALGKVRNDGWIRKGDTGTIYLTQEEMNSSEICKLRLNLYWDQGYQYVDFDVNLSILCGRTLVMTQEGNHVTLSYK